jgi:hypothetical protein
MKIEGLSLHQQFDLCCFNDKVLLMNDAELRLLALEMYVTILHKDNRFNEIIEKRLIGEPPSLSDMR